MLLCGGEPPARQRSQDECGPKGVLLKAQARHHGPPWRAKQAHVVMVRRW